VVHSKGQPVVHILTESKTEVPVRVIDNGDRTFRVEFETTVTSGTLEVTVTFDYHPVPHSPFKVTVHSTGGGDASKVVVKDLPESESCCLKVEGGGRAKIIRHEAKDIKQYTSQSFC